MARVRIKVAEMDYALVEKDSWRADDFFRRAQSEALHTFGPSLTGFEREHDVYGDRSILWAHVDYGAGVVLTKKDEMVWEASAPVTAVAAPAAKQQQRLLLLLTT